MALEDFESEDMPDMDVANDDAKDEREISGILRAEIDAAIHYSESEYETERSKAIEYYHGRMRDVPDQDGRSSVVSYDVADTIGEIMPSLMRVFFSGGRVVEYEPSNAMEEAQAEQATDYINHLFIKKCDGYNVLWDSFHDGLLHRNGVLTYFYDNKPSFAVHYYTGLTEDQLAQIQSSEGVEILAATPHQEMMQDPMSGQQVPMPVFDVKIRRVKERGRVKIQSVPPEEFLINREATCIADARFVARRYLTTRSDLRLEGYEPEIIDALPTHSELEFSETVTERFDENVLYRADGLDESQQEVQIFDCYIRMDVDGDGVAEWMHCVMGGDVGDEANILLAEEWHDEVPFTDLTPERVPHRWQGRSIFDEVHDIQKIKTVVLRATLDSAYASNNPDEFVNESAIVDPDELLTRELGRRVRVKGDPRAAVMAHQLPFIGNHTFPMLDFLDQIIVKRTGISQSSAALDPEVLSNQSATAANLAASAQYSKIELIARNYAEQLRRAFRAILKLVIENTDRAEMIRLRGEFVEFDPRSWNADMDCTVNIGLGTGSRDRDMAMLQAVAMEQDKYLDNLGPNNPYVSVPQRVETSRKIAEAGGLRNAEIYFRDPNEQELAQFQQMMAQKEGQPDAETQAKMQQEQMKLQADQARQQAEMQLKQAEMQAELQLKREQLQAEMQLKREQLAAELELKRELEIAKMQAGIATASMRGMGSSGVQMGGEPG